MKRLLILTLTISSYWGYAQENKATGGCAYSASFVHIVPELVNSVYLINGTSYFIRVNLMESDIPCTGDIKVKLDDIVIGQLSGCSTGEYTIPTIPINVPPGDYMLKLYFYGGYSGPPDWSLMQTKKVTVLNSVGIKSITASAGITVHPNPASNVVTLSVAEDVIADLKLINTAGQLIRTLHCGEPEVTLSVKELPVGMYLLQLQTEGNAFVQKLQVAR